MVMVYFLVEQKLIFRERLNEFFFLMCDVPDAVILVPLFHITLADWIGITGFNMFGIHVRRTDSVREKNIVDWPASSSIPCGRSRQDFITLHL